MGKTEKGAIWLNQKLLFHMIIGKFENINDRDVKRFLNFFTELITLKIDEICMKSKILIN